ncbi:MAG TPA: acyltransferase [Bryobacteraceae bacterium]|jgi:acetyltransferase-like isoleucine patch superfamily enzyme
MRSNISNSSPAREVAATFGRRARAEDPVFERQFAATLRESHSPRELLDILARFAAGENAFDMRMRRVLFAALCRSTGHDLQVAPNVVLKHPETMEFGDSVFIGAQCMIQGRFDGTCKIGDHVWIGPQAYFDARDLVLEDYVGWGPGAKVLGSAHTGRPIEDPIITTGLTIQPVRVRFGADIGMNASILPGVTVGAHAIVGAGAVVIEDVPDYAIVAGVPARMLRDRRKEHNG